MQVVYIDDKYKDLTKGKIYTVLGERKSPTSSIEDDYLIENDYDVEKWFGWFGGVITFAELYNEYIRFIGDEYNGLTKGKVYQLCGRMSTQEYYYFVDDKNEFVGIPKRNYFGGAHYFEKFDRDDKIDLLLNER